MCTATLQTPGGCASDVGHLQRVQELGLAEGRRVRRPLGWQWLVPLWRHRLQQTRLTHGLQLLGCSNIPCTGCRTLEPSCSIASAAELAHVGPSESRQTSSPNSQRPTSWKRELKGCRKAAVSSQKWRRSAAELASAARRAFSGPSSGLAGSSRASSAVAGRVSGLWQGQQAHSGMSRSSELPF